MGLPSTTRFTFTSKHVANTTLVAPSGEPVYMVAPSQYGKATTVSRLGGAAGPGEPLASISLHTWGSDRVTLRGREGRAKDWVIGKRTFTAASNRTYEWVHKSGAYELRRPGSKEVLARHLAPSRGVFSGEKRKLPVMEVGDAALPDLDDIFASFVYISMKKEKSKKNNEGVGAVGEVLGAIGG